ncbi:MAG: phosphate ABC transporter ATP-binding protein [Candidatus Omnitrophica bacterium]|nr:phosphate ABC transporter ATP-binding protein [Candidatus Omnitrophota bacterium]
MVVAASPATKMALQEWSVWYGAIQALKSVSLDIRSQEILGVIGPANSGKTSFLRSLNRMNDINPAFRADGRVTLDGKDLYEDFDGQQVRRRIGIVFALPLPLPLSIRENVTYGPRMRGERNASRLEELTERSLRAASLWDEVKDRLDVPAMKLSGGQQQRLCIARTLAMEPEVVLFDEPCSGLDPISTAKVEETMVELKSQYTLVLVTNNTKQAARVSDRVAFFLMGELIELDLTDVLFTTPRDQRTNDYITGRFG